MGSGLLRILAPLFRYSARRDAWVLRGIGNRFGPVLTRRRPASQQVDSA